MAETKMVDLNTVIGVYSLCNTGAVLVHENPEWCAMTEEYMEVTGETELGFTLGSFFIPLCEVVRFYSG